jgi:hypothetical protein
LPELDAFYKQEHDRGVVVVGLTDGKSEADCARLAATVSYPVARTTTEFFRKTGVAYVPVNVVLDRTGKVAPGGRFDRRGHLDDLFSKVRSLL